MGCRKAADRAMVEMAEWMEAQQEKNAEKLAALEKEQRSIWTPSDLFDACCTQWLVNGTIGCAGGCGKDHPRVTLVFEGKAIAHLSHALDPFLEHFDALCRSGQATKTSILTYDLTGFLTSHVEKLTTRFGTDLIKVSSTALAASKRAHQQHLETEELQQAAKRRKIRGSGAGMDLLESVLDICYDHCLLDHLDVADIAWMRLSCRSMAKIAAKMASTRSRQIRLSYSVLLDGTYSVRNQGTHQGTYSFIVSPDSRRRQNYRVAASRLPLPFVEDSFVPTQNSYHWKHETMDTNYVGHLVRVYLEGGWIENLPEKDCLGVEPIEVARFVVDPRTVQEGSNELFGLSFSVESNEKRTTVNGCDHFEGHFSIKAIDFGFRDFAGVYVRKKLRQAKQHMQDIQRVRPVTRTYKNYVRALAKAAREAPRSSRYFEGLEGW